MKIYKNDLKGLALTRLREAKVLLANGEYSGAYYLAGYVIECALKACIAKQTQRHEFPDKNRAAKSWGHEPIEIGRRAWADVLPESRE